MEISWEVVFFPRYEKLPLDYRAPFLLTLEPPGPLPLVSGRSASSSLASLSRYLYHQRWLWSVPSGLAPALPLSAIAQLLSILTEYVTEAFQAGGEGRASIDWVWTVAGSLSQTVPLCKPQCQVQSCSCCCSHPLPSPPSIYSGLWSSLDC